MARILHPATASGAGSAPAASPAAPHMRTTKRTTHGHMVTWFVPRQPLTALDRAGRKPVSRKPPRGKAMFKPQRGWTKHKQQQRRGNQQRGRYPLQHAGWGVSVRRRPWRPSARSWSDRCPSLRLEALPFAPLEHILLQSGTHFSARQPLFSDENEPISLAPFASLIDEYGSNDALFRK